MKEPLRALSEAGVSIWLDMLSRDLLETGEFERFVRECAVSGATSNPTIFAKAITGTERYDPQLRHVAARGLDDPQAIFVALGLEDIRRAAAILRPTYERSHGAQGYVSFECTPDLAHDTGATIEQALDFWQRLDLPNVLIKVPATAAGIPAIEELTAKGVSINVTLLFSVARYEEAAEAYLRGLERRADRGQELGRLFSVASFFVSRVDSKADALLAGDSPLRGRIALANAHRAYGRYLERFAGARWERLETLGATPQRPLWASTGSKDPAYSDVLYVEQLIAPGVINTMPEATLRAFADHGTVGPALESDSTEAERTLTAAAAAGLNLDSITTELEHEGVQAFCRSYDELLDCIETRLTTLGRRRDPPATHSASRGPGQSIGST